MKTQVISLENKKVGDIDLDEAVFGAPVRKDIIARMVNWQLAERRAGTHKVKGRSEVSATNAKPFNQKGTGQNTTWSLYSGLEFLLIGDAPFKKLDAQTKIIEVSNIKIYSWYGSYYN